MKVFFLLFLCCVVQVSAESKDKLTDEEYQQLRSVVLEQYSHIPIQAVEKADEYLVLYKDQYTLSQNLRMHYTKAYFLIASEQFEAAFSVLSECKILADELNDPNLTYYYYSYLAGILDTLESYQLSLETYLKGMKYAEKTKDKRMIAQAQNNIGHVLIKFSQFEQAKAYIDKFYQYGLSVNNLSYIATALNNLGDISLGLGDLIQAKIHFLESLAIRKEENYINASSWSHYNLGRVYLLTKEYSKAINHLQKSIDIRVKYKLELESLKPQVTLAEVYMQMQNYQAALPLINHIIEEANKLNNYRLASDGYDLLRRYHVSQNELLPAMQASDRYVETKLALMERKASTALMHYVAEADLHSKEMDNMALRKENELIGQQAQAKQTQLILLLSLGGTIILIILFFARTLSNKNKRLNATIDELQKTQQDLIEADKMSAMTTLVSGIAHQLNTPLSVVITANSIMRERLHSIENKLKRKSLNLQSFEQYISEAKSILDLSEKNSDKTAELVQRFKLISAELEGSKVSSFELKLFILEKLKLIASQYQQLLSVEVTGAEVQVLNYPEVLFKVLEQLVKNSTEHKPENTENLLAKVEINIKADNIDIIYTDNGQGINEQIRSRIFDPFFTTKGMQKSLGLGLNIAYNSVLHLMQGKLHCPPSESGACFIIEIPKTIDNISEEPA